MAKKLLLVKASQIIDVFLCVWGGCGAGVLTQDFSL